MSRKVNIQFLGNVKSSVNLMVDWIQTRMPVKKEPVKKADRPQVSLNVRTSMPLGPEPGQAAAANQAPSGAKRAVRAPRMSRNVQRLRKAASVKPGAGERLLRNSAIASVLLLAVMVAYQFDHPWSRQLRAGVDRVVTARIDLDETLGKLSFVREWVPDTALVFWNAGKKKAMPPVEGTLTHAYDSAQPWLEYACGAGENVVAVMEGTVLGTSQSAQGDWVVLIRHKDMSETLYAYLGEVMVERGQSVPKGAAIGTAANSPQAQVYFEYRVDGNPADPTDILGL